ncbi:hypothetical protein [Gaiella sp.]|uniref:hypothetical protein n=1 Tax=Gaiella sp. TaxID=2663207 RepID=UPI002E321F09|nr:hypothetical protein [Gaiella sp.]HEX5583979.1 hypothetical protein [Gaiella sp.]
MRLSLAVLLFIAIVSACGSGSATQRDEAPSSTRSSPSAASRIERCVDRLLHETAIASRAEEDTLRRYVRDTYCARFEERGWVYEDGALSIAAQTWLDEGVTCVTGSEGEPTRTVPCETERGGGGRVLDCALLHVVRRGEVGDYIARLRTDGPVNCDDGTDVDELGIP